MTRTQERDNPGKDDSGKDDSGKDDSGKDDSGKDDSGKGDSGKDDSGKDDSGKNDSGKDDSGKDNSGKDDSGKDNSGKNDSDKGNQNSSTPGNNNNNNNNGNTSGNNDQNNNCQNNNNTNNNSNNQNNSSNNEANNDTAITPVPAVINASDITLTKSKKKANIITSIESDGKFSLKSSNTKVVKISGKTRIQLTQVKPMLPLPWQPNPVRCCIENSYHNCNSCKNKPAFCKIKNSKTSHCYLEKGQIHQRLSDQLQSEQQHEKGENPYRKRFCYTRNLKETGFKEKILCTDPHLQSYKRQKILFQMEFQKIRKNQIMSNARSASLNDAAWHFS